MALIVADGRVGKIAGSGLIYCHGLAVSSGIRGAGIGVPPRRENQHGVGTQRVGKGAVVVPSAVFLVLPALPAIRQEEAVVVAGSDR